MQDNVLALSLLINDGWIEWAQKLSCFVLLLSLEVYILKLRNQPCFMS